MITLAGIVMVLKGISAFFYPNNIDNLTIGILISFFSGLVNFILAKILIKKGSKMAIAASSFSIYAFEALKKDKTYLNARATYDAVPPNKKVYNRFTTSFLIAFDGLPKLIKPKEATKLFELRTYEGYSEDAVRRKVDMFNKEEFSIFDATGLNSVFFGEQISGPLMPALTYMLAFESMEERNINWEKFSKNSEWKRVSILKEYSNTVSDIKRVFLKPLEYSQL